jgi:hypothetical protein
MYFTYEMAKIVLIPAIAGKKYQFTRCLDLESDSFTPYWLENFEIHGGPKFYTP